MEGDEVNITDASKKRIERLAAVHEPPAAWRASTLRTIAGACYDMAQFDWAEFLRQEADRIEESE